MTGVNKRGIEISCVVRRGIGGGRETETPNFAKMARIWGLAGRGTGDGDLKAAASRAIALATAAFKFKFNKGEYFIM